MQASNIDCCMHMHTQNKGCGSPCTCSQQILFKNWVWLTKANVTEASVVAPPYRVFLNFASHVIQSRSDPDNFKAGLTRMTQTKCDQVTRPGFNADVNYCSICLQISICKAMDYTVIAIIIVRSKIAS